MEDNTALNAEKSVFKFSTHSSLKTLSKLETERNFLDVIKESTKNIYRN